MGLIEHGEAAFQQILIKIIQRIFVSNQRVLFIFFIHHSIAQYFNYIKTCGSKETAMEKKKSLSDSKLLPRMPISLSLHCERSPMQRTKKKERESIYAFSIHDTSTQHV
jgi:hypothetical protein